MTVEHVRWCTAVTRSSNSFWCRSPIVYRPLQSRNKAKRVATQDPDRLPFTACQASHALGSRNQAVIKASSPTAGRKSRGRAGRQDKTRPDKTPDTARAHLKVGCEIRIAVGLPNQLSDFTTKDVMHNARALLKVMQTGQQSLD